MKCIYLITNMVNGKVYVGQTKDLARRKYKHLYAARVGKKQLLYCAMRKHGIENFTFEVIEECTDELIDDRERHWVAHYDSFNPEKGYNLTRGGEGTSGYRFTDEVKDVIRQKAQGREHTDDTRRKIGKSQLGRVHTPETRQKMSASLSGDKNPMSGKRGAKCPNAKLTQAQADDIMRRLNAGESVALLAEEYGVSKLTIRRIRNGQAYVNREVTQLG